MFKPEGVYPAILTPFGEDGNINEVVLRELVDWLIDKGVSGLFPLGSAGEFIYLSFEEKRRIIEIICDQSKRKVPVTPGTTESCAPNCVKMTRIAYEYGCSAAVIAPPYYITISQKQIEAHYENVLKTLPYYPIILYNIPLFSIPIDSDVVKRLSRFHNVVGLKDSSGNMVDFMHFMDKIRLIGSDLNIMVGREEMFYTALAVGAKGTMTVSASVIPEYMIGIYNAWQKGDKDQALQMQFRILPLIRAMFSLPFPLGFKAALELRGFKMGEAKRPLSNHDKYNYKKIVIRIEKMLCELDLLQR